MPSTEAVDISLLPFDASCIAYDAGYDASVVRSSLVSDVDGASRAAPNPAIISEKPPSEPGEAEAAENENPGNGSSILAPGE